MGAEDREGKKNSLFLSWSVRILFSFFHAMSDVSGIFKWLLKNVVVLRTSALVLYVEDRKKGGKITSSGKKANLY